MSEEGPLRKLLRGEGPILSTLRGKERMQGFPRRRLTLASLPVDKQQLAHVDDLLREAYAIMRSMHDKFPPVERWGMGEPIKSPSYVNMRWEEVLDELREARVKAWQIGHVLYGDEWESRNPRDLHNPPYTL